MGSLGSGSKSPAKLLKDTMLYTVTGLAIVITSGLMLFTTDPLRYYYNSSFRTKIAFLVLAIVFNLYDPPLCCVESYRQHCYLQSLWDSFSIFLWVGVVFRRPFLRLHGPSPETWRNQMSSLR